jgi:chromosome segregation ATPase
MKKNDELIAHKQGIEKKDIELHSLQNDLEEKERDLQKAISSMNNNQETITDLQKQLEKTHQDLMVHIGELENLKQEQQQSTLESDQIKRDLKKRLDQLDEKCITISQLKNEAEDQQTRFTSLVKEFGTVKQELDTKTMEMEKAQAALRVSHTDVDHLTIKLSEKKMEGELKTKEIASFFEQWKKSQGTINKEQVEWLESLLNKKEKSPSSLKEEASDIPAATKSLAGDIDHIMKTGEEHQNQLHDNITWKEELRICNEIEKCLDHSTEDHLKTKKLKDEEPK